MGAAARYGMDEGMTQPASGTRNRPTAPPPSMHSRAMNRERIDRTILRSLGERRVYRTLRRNGSRSSWDRLEQLVAHAATSLWENTELTESLGEDLAGFCAFLARELEINEQLDLEPTKDAARLRSLAPRALDALDEITAPLVLEESKPQLRILAKAFGDIRAELLSAGGEATLTMAA